MGLAHLLAGTFAKAIDELPAGILPVKSEIIAEVYDPAVGTDLMRIDELTGYAMSEAKEDHIRIIQFGSETELGFPEQIPVHRCHRSSFGRGRGCSHNLHLRVVQQYPEQLSSGISCASGNRHSYLSVCIHINCNLLIKRWQPPFHLFTE